MERRVATAKAISERLIPQMPSPSIISEVFKLVTYCMLKEVIFNRQQENNSWVALDNVGGNTSQSPTFQVGCQRGWRSGA